MLRYAPFLLCFSVIAQPAGIQRTMSMLASGQKTRILFYGQSITKQEWTRTVSDDLRRRFPKAEIEIRNLSIGGYESTRLIRTTPQDVYPFYPDLVIFYDYGPEPEYEQIIAGIRANTTAEILLQNDHLAVQDVANHDRHSFEWLPRLAEKYHLGFVDQRTPWKQYLEKNNLKVTDLLKDNVHLNARGNALMAEIVSQALQYDSSLPADKSGIQTYEVAWHNGRARVEFDGNRVEAIGSGGEVQVLIDGKKPSQFPELYAISRANDTWSVDWPCINRISANAPLLIENWTARITQADATLDNFSFEVTGSRTGPDGSGNNRARFVSNSGRVVMEPGDWEAMKRAFNLKPAIPLPPNFEVKWSVIPLFQDSIQGESVLASGLPNTHHVIELRGKGNPKVTLRTYRPAQSTKLIP